jgi:hypothetical protein
MPCAIEGGVIKISYAVHLDIGAHEDGFAVSSELDLLCQVRQLLGAMLHRRRLQKAQTCVTLSCANLSRSLIRSCLAAL